MAAPEALARPFRVPDNIIWTVTITDSETQPGDDEEEIPSVLGELEVLEEREVAVAGPVRRETNRFSNGTSVERWFFRGHAFREDPNGDLWVYSPEDDERIPDFSQTPFPELAWVTDELAEERVVFGGVECVVYRLRAGTLSKEAESDAGTEEDHDAPTAPVSDPRRILLEAFINASNGLPVALRTSTGSWQHYAFSPLPGGRLELPASHVSAWRGYQQALARHRFPDVPQ